MKLFSWNVNGYISCNRFDGLSKIIEASPDFICLQETKVADPVHLSTLFTMQYVKYYNFSINKGHNGVFIYAKQPASNVNMIIGNSRFDQDGRFICLDYPDYSIINIYIPHGGRDKRDIPYKLEVYEALYHYLENKKKENKDIILVGDFNVASSEYDLERYKSNTDNTMYTEAEKEAFHKLFTLGLKDIYRDYNPTKRQYTWWPYAYDARKKNIGWRIDYCLATNQIIQIREITLHKEILGSDHCPIEITF